MLGQTFCHKDIHAVEVPEGRHSAQFAVRTYLDAPANEEALFIMVKSYDALGLNDLRDDAERVMRTNFPNSDYYKRGLDRKEPWWKLW